MNSNQTSRTPDARPNEATTLKWAAEQDAILRLHFPNAPLDELVELTGRTEKSIRARAAKLKLSRPPRGTRAAKPKADRALKTYTHPFICNPATERLVIPLEKRRLCNGSSTQPYVCTELSYRGQA